ncbi:MAG: TonB-dependent receptor [Acidobacteria bacterium]|jgi:outer membrane receptor protein involved in Fe transport|nr:TonB-dependent receptor [Acidobacteriota bacterium]
MKPHRIVAAAFATLAIMVSVSTSAQAQETGRIKGRVLDDYNAVTLPGAPVQVVGTDTTVFTDMDGAFDIRLAPGTYDLKVTFSGYDDSISRGVVVTAGETTELSVILSLGTVKMEEEITVTAEAPAATTQAAALLERKKSGTVSDGLAREEMSANADSDASEAMSRMTGVSVVGGQYVYVRGLGERYSNTTLNGSVLPSTEPDKRVVPLDLFPTSLLESVKVTKSYMPDKPAEFSGGLLEIEPINFPDGPVLSLSFGGGYNSNTTGKDGLSYPGGGLDWLGFDDGRRALPAGIPSEKVVPASRFGGGFTQQEIQAFGRSFENIWEPQETTGKPDTSFSILAGNSWDKLGAVGSITYNYKNRFRSEAQQFYALGEGNTGLRPTNDFDFRYSTYRATLGAVGNLSYRFSGSHRLAWENFYTNSGQDEARVFEGYQEDKGVPLRNQRIYWIQESVLSSKLSGEHFFPSLGNSRLEWRATYSRARRDEPDLRENLYEFRPSVGDFEWSNESQSGFRMFNDLTDNVYDGAVDWQVLLSGSGRSTLVKFGGEYTRRTRNFLSRRLRFKPTRIRPVDLTQSPEVIFQEENIGESGDFQLEEDTRPTDRYDATHDIYAGYAMVDLPITQRLRFIGGARVESSQQEVITKDPFDPTIGVVPANLDNTDVLPGLNVVYQLTADQNLRAAFSQTVNRPEFRELAPFEFTDIVGGRAVVGNPDLRRAKIMNADLRWEWFPAGGAADGEVIGFSAFWKDFTDPIEKVVEATAQFRNTYQNAKGARNIGFELEGRKSFGPYVLVGLNYTYTNSQIELERGAAQVQTNLDRPLAGQSPHVANAMLELRNRSQDLFGRVLVNYFDNRIADVGVLGTPDILEEGRTTLDVVVTKTFGTWALRLTGTNLTDAEYLFTQGGQFQRLFKEGRSISLGVSYSR